MASPDRILPQLLGYSNIPPNILLHEYEVYYYLVVNNQQSPYKTLEVCSTIGAANDRVRKALSEWVHSRIIQWDESEESDGRIRVDAVIEDGQIVHIRVDNVQRNGEGVRRPVRSSRGEDGYGGWAGG